MGNLRRTFAAGARDDASDEVVLLAVDRATPARVVLGGLEGLRRAGFRRAELLFALATDERTLPPSPIDDELRTSLGAMAPLVERELGPCPAARAAYLELIARKHDNASILVRAIQACGCRPTMLTVEKLLLHAVRGAPLSALAIDLAARARGARRGGAVVVAGAALGAAAHASRIRHSTECASVRSGSSQRDRIRSSTFSGTTCAAGRCRFCSRNSDGGTSRYTMRTRAW